MARPGPRGGTLRYKSDLGLNIDVSSMVMDSDVKCSSERQF